METVLQVSVLDVCGDPQGPVEESFTRTAKLGPISFRNTFFLRVVQAFFDLRKFGKNYVKNFYQISQKIVLRVLP
jgi:hypothetical protein